MWGFEILYESKRVEMSKFFKVLNKSGMSFGSIKVE